MDVGSVRAHDELVRYLAELSESVRTGEVRVENATAANLLEAASAWVDAMDGHFTNRNEAVPQSPDRSIVASIFSAALIYE